MSGAEGGFGRPGRRASEDPYFRRRRERVRLPDGREGVRSGAAVDALWTIEVDDGEVLYCSDRRPEPEGTVTLGEETAEQERERRARRYGSTT